MKHRKSTIQIQQINNRHRINKLFQFRHPSAFPQLQFKSREKLVAIVTVKFLTCVFDSYVIYIFMCCF